MSACEGSVLYSDDESKPVVVRNSVTTPPTPLSEIPNEPGKPPLFLSRDDAWFAQLRNVRFSCFRALNAGEQGTSQCTSCSSLTAVRMPH